MEQRSTKQSILIMDPGDVEILRQIGVWDQMVGGYDVEDVSRSQFDQLREDDRRLDYFYDQMKTARSRFGQKHLGPLWNQRHNILDDETRREFKNVSDEELKTATLAVIRRDEGGAPPLVLGGTDIMKRMAGMVTYSLLSPEEQKEAVDRYYDQTPDHKQTNRNFAQTAFEVWESYSPVENTTFRGLLEKMRDDQVLSQDEFEVAQNLWLDLDDDLARREGRKIDIQEQVERGEQRSRGGRRGGKQLDPELLQKQMDEMGRIEEQRSKQEKERQDRSRRQREDIRKDGIGSQRDKDPNQGRYVEIVGGMYERGEISLQDAVDLPDKMQNEHRWGRARAKRQQDLDDQKVLRKLREEQTGETDWIRVDNPDKVKLQQQELMDIEKQMSEELSELDQLDKELKREWKEAVTPEMERGTDQIGVREPDEIKVTEEELVDPEQEAQYLNLARLELERVERMSDYQVGRHGPVLNPQSGQRATKEQWINNLKGQIEHYEKRLAPYQSEEKPKQTGRSKPEGPSFNDR